MSKDCIICDIDGTLANNKHRQHHLTPLRMNWDAFFDAMEDDIVFAEVRMLLDAFWYGEPDIDIILVSGRPDNYLAQTVNWLANNRIQFDKLFLRKKGDYRPDTIVKHEILLGIRQQGYNVMLSIDDRPEVVDMWRRSGVPCLQCDPSDWKLKAQEKHDGDPIKFLRSKASAPDADPMYRVCLDALERAK